MGETFNILNYDSLVGTFTNIVSLNPGYAYGFLDAGGGQGELVVTAVAPTSTTPEPGAWALLAGLATTGLVLYRRRNPKSKNNRKGENTWKP